MKANIEFTKTYENEGEVKVRLTLPEEVLTIQQYGRTIFGAKLATFKTSMNKNGISPLWRKLFLQIYEDLIELSEHINETATKG